MSEKLEYLKQLYDQFGEFELFFSKSFDPETKRAVAGWKSWKKYSECTDAEKEQANLRTVMKEEVVLDIEEPELIHKILEELNALQVTYVCFETGSRGYHIHMVFNEMKQSSPEKNTIIKDSIIRYFGCDISKKSERNLIALEYEPHFKTGRPKKMYAAKSLGANNLDMFLTLTIRLRDLKNVDPKFYDVYNNQEGWKKWGFPSRSEAEQYLCTTLAQYGFNELQMFEIMERSNVGKWHEKTDSYKRMTIQKAMKWAEKFVTQDITAGETLFKFFEEYGIPSPVSWLVPKYIPSKGVTIITGAAGCGKSFITEEMITAILNNRKWFNHFNIINGKPIVLIDMENDHSTLYERINKLGGVPPNSLTLFDFEKNFDIMNPNYVAALNEQITNLDPCVVIFDTLRRVYSGDENDSRVINEIYKKVLMPISKQRCVILIAHTRKSNKNNQHDTDDMMEIRGTGDITGLASSVIMLKKNPDLSILVKPIKLRPAKLPEAFTIKIEEIKERFILSFIENAASSLTEIEILRDNMVSWLQHNIKPMNEVKTKQIREAMLTDGHKERNIAQAIRILTGHGILLKKQHGIYQFIFGDDSIGNYV